MKSRRKNLFESRAQDSWRLERGLIDAFNDLFELKNNGAIDEAEYDEFKAEYNKFYYSHDKFLDKCRAGDSANFESDYQELVVIYTKTMEVYKKILAAKRF